MPRSSSTRQSTLVQFQSWCISSRLGRSRWFDINAYTVGYTRDIGIFGNVETGLEANLMLYGIHDSIKTELRRPSAGVSVYLRLRLKENR